MKLTKLLLTSTTALGLSMSAAVADNNDAFLDQNGVNNQALIDQSAADNSVAGQDGNDETVSQDGRGNNLTIIQNGDGQVVGSGGRFQQRANNNRARIIQGGSNNEFVFMDQFAPGSNSIQNSNNLRVRQTGDNNIVKEVRQTQNGGLSGDKNDLDIFQQNGTNLRVGGRVQQTGTGNEMDIYQTGSSNTVSPVNANVVLQDGHDNFMDIDQAGDGNLLRQAQQIGDENSSVIDISGMNNGNGALTTGGASVKPLGASAASGASASIVDQIGNYNQVDLMISGVSNEYGTLQDGNENLALNIVVTGNDNSVGVGQYGDRNEISLATLAGDNSSVGFYQRGDDNFAFATVRNRQDALISQEGDRNRTTLDANAADISSASLSVTGDDNVINAKQRQRRNVMHVDVQGDGNNNTSLLAPAFSGDAATVNTVGLAPGDLVQLGTGNSGGSRNDLLITGVNADNNSFATYQQGDRNAIDFEIDTGFKNQAVIVQVGADNSATLSQSGSFNIAGITQ